MDFPRAAASIANLLSVLFRSLRLSGRAQFLLNSNVSFPFLSVLTGRYGYSLGGSAGAGFWEVLARDFCHRGSEPAEVAALRPQGELAEEQQLLQDFTWPWIGH